MSYRYRRAHGWTAVLILLISIGFTYAEQQGWFDSAGKQLEANQPGLYKIDHFIDGDTIAVNMNGQVEDIRFVGVDTPETHKPNTPVECYGPAAAAFTKSQIGNQRVRLVSDSLSTDRDRYGRLLRYVYLPDGTNLDQRLIEQGYGFYYPYFPFSKAHQFKVAEKQAIAAHRGLWGNCHPTPTDDGGYVMNEPAQ
ncbi:MAG TPA: thermonuclease family protein [Candidatus Saccharimonadales bacterium]|nr:thermonuclease family protein [Candidatus Saccharimonadales bacterium]